MEAVGLLPLMPVLCMITLDKILQIFKFQLVGFQSKMFVGPEIINPQFFGPWFLAGWLTVEE